MRAAHHPDIQLIFLAVLLQGCGPAALSDMDFTEIQLTHDPYGHFMNHTQCFSPDNEWIVYDTRNDDTHIGRTRSIEMVHTGSGEIKPLYQTQDQTEYGPGVGAVTFSPVSGRVLFIHGIRNADREHPYGLTRRTGVAIDVEHPFRPVFIDARDIAPPYTPGALRGGTHAHLWSGDGKWISFTYNDYVIERLAKKDSSFRDLRTVGVSAPFGPVGVVDTGLENNSGELFSVVIAEVTAHPKWGSDEIEKAFDECWIGRNGYLKPGGSTQKRAIAFQGNVRDSLGNLQTDVFVADLPEDPTRSRLGKPLEGSAHSRPNPPEGVRQTRITFGTEIQGPRHWLRSTPDGSLIGFLAKDEKGVIQIFGVSPNGGAIRQLTFTPFSVQEPFSFSNDGRYAAYIADNSVFVCDMESGKSKRLTKRAEENNGPVNGVVWSPDDKMLTYNRYVESGEGRFLQVFLLK